MRWLSSVEAETYLTRFRDDFARRGKRMGMDADRGVLTYGHAGSGAGLFPGRRCDFAELADHRGSVFVDGDLIVDAWVENVGGLVFVAGNLITHSLHNSGYLIVAGDLCTTRLFGEDERYGTLVFGDAVVGSAVLSGNHHFDVWGDCRIDEVVCDETDGKDAMRARLEAWGVGEDVRVGLRTWGAEQGRLSDELANRRWSPKPPLPPVIATLPMTPARSVVLVELERWIETCGLPQRKQAALLRRDWLARIGADERAEAKRLIKRAINSKKLASERDELLAALDAQVTDRV